MILWLTSLTFAEVPISGTVHLDLAGGVLTSAPVLGPVLGGRARIGPVVGSAQTMLAARLPTYDTAPVLVVGDAQLAVDLRIHERVRIGLGGTLDVGLHAATDQNCTNGHGCRFNDWVGEEGAGFGATFKPGAGPVVEWRGSKGETLEAGVAWFSVFNYDYGLVLPRHALAYTSPRQLRLHVQATRFGVTGGVGRAW